MKKLLIVLLCLGLGGICFSSDVVSQPDSKSYKQKTGKSQAICEKWHGTEVKGIYQCENERGDKVYIQMLRCEDCPSLYFDKDKKIISSCCTGMCTDESTVLCEKLKKYKCDFKKNLLSDICKKVEASR